MVTTPTPTPDVDATRQVGHQPPFVSTQTLGAVDTGCESSSVATPDLGSVVTGRETLVPTQTLASVGTTADILRARSSTGECPTVEAQTSYGYPAVGDAREVA